MNALTSHTIWFEGSAPLRARCVSEARTESGEPFCSGGPAPLLRAARAIVFLAVTSALTAADLPAVKALPTTPPKLDGALDDQCWQQAQPCHLRLASSQQPTQKTVAKVCQDGWSLFVAFQCHESNMATLAKGTTKRDGPHWMSDCVELFLDPIGDGRGYLHFAVSAAGGLFDEEVMSAGWHADWRAATKLGPYGWIAELEIPFSCLGLTPAIGSKWRVNFCREEKPSGENSSWAPVGDRFHNPSQFGVLRIDADLSRFHVALALLADSYALGKNTARVAIDNLSNAERRGSAVITGTAPNGSPIEKARRWLVMPPRGRRQCGLQLDLPELGKYDLTLALFQGDKRPVAIRHAKVEVPAIRFSPPGARIKWIMHQRGGQATLMVVHDCASRAEDVTFEAAGLQDGHGVEVIGEGRTIRPVGLRFTDRLAGYGTKLYRWRLAAE